MDNIDFNLCKIFYYVYSLGSFSKAGRELGVTQPAISQKISTLEKQLGVTLFIRGDRTIRPTKEAESLIPFIEEGIEKFNNGFERVTQVYNMEKGKISIGIPSHIATFFLTDIIKIFSLKYPNIDIKVSNQRTDELLKRLVNNELDFVIDTSPLNNIYELKVKKLCTEKCIFISSIKNTDLLKEDTSLEDLQDYSLIVPSRKSACSKALEETYKRFELEFFPKYEMTTSDLIIDLVTKNVGIGFVFEKTIKGQNDIVKITVKEKLPSFDILMLYKENMMSVTAKKMIDYILSNYRNGE